MRLCHSLIITGGEYFSTMILRGKGTATALLHIASYGLFFIVASSGNATTNLILRSSTLSVQTRE